MRPLRQVSEPEVWDHWRTVEHHLSADFRSDIREKLPTNLVWYLCQIEKEDVPKFFIISSDDWMDISGSLFQVVEVLRRLREPSGNAQPQRIAQYIRNMVALLESGQQLDTRLIAITDSPSLFGPFTLLEGNKRSVAFAETNGLIGCEAYIGSSPCVAECVWTRHTYRSFLESRRRL